MNRCLGEVFLCKEINNKVTRFVFKQFCHFFLQQLFFSFTVRVAEDASFYDESKGLSRRAFFF